MRDMNRRFIRSQGAPHAGQAARVLAAPIPSPALSGPNVLAGDEEASLRPARIEHLGDVALGQVRGAPGCLNDICSGTERGETEHHLLLEASGSGPGSQVARADLCVTEPFE